MPASIPPIKTPSTPHRASAYSVSSSTAKQVVKHGSSFESLISLLMLWETIILERGSLPGFQDLGETIEQLGTLLVTPEVTCSTD